MLTTEAPKVCKMMAFMAIILGLGLSFHILLGLGKDWSLKRSCIGSPVTSVFSDSGAKL